MNTTLELLHALFRFVPTPLRRLGLVCGWIGWWTVAVSADGKFYPPIAYPVGVTIPDQRALICFSNGVERLVIETRFATSASNIAWVVPLPAPPEIEEASAGLFPTLRHLFRPEVVHGVPRVFAAWLFLGGLVFLTLTVQATRHLTGGDVMGCLVAGVGLGAGTVMLVGVTVGLVLLWVVHGIRRGRAGVGDILAVSLLVFLILGTILSALAPAGSKATAGAAPAAEGVTVLERKLLAAHETTTITARQPEALVAWLTTNGFAVGATSLPVIADYVREGWVFVAAKVRDAGFAGVTNSVRPLAFTFPTARAVYPMRLTGVDATGLGVELYVFGDARAEAPGFTVQHCGSVETRRIGSLGPAPAPLVPLAHPLLQRWAGGTTVATRLNAQLTPDQMRQDIWLDWVPKVETRETLHSRTAARTIGANTASGLVVVGGLVTTVWWRFWPRSFPRHGWIKLMGWIVAVAATLGAVSSARLPTVEVVLLQSPRFWTGQAQAGLARELSSLTSNGGASLADVRRQLGELAEWPPRWRENPFLGGPIREEDSPGNYVLREEGGRVRAFWYDADGAEVGRLLK